jgi:hypothetical protein
MTLPIVQSPWVAIDLAEVDTFDYAALAPGVVFDLRAQAERIRKRIAPVGARGPLEAGHSRRCLSKIAHSEPAVAHHAPEVCT